MKSITCIIITLFIIQAQQINGFSKKNQSDQRDLESDFKELPKPEQFREHLRTITREPHVAGDEGSKKVVSYLTQSMIKAGLKVEEFDYDIYLPNKPTFNSVEIVTPKRMPLNNKEDIRDRFSGSPQMSHGWNAYSGNGDVTAEVVYANFGRKEDFEELAKMGVSVKGKIAIARYGGNFRGYKAKYAQEAGAAGLIIYTDPENGGYASGLGYPEGPYASESTIQRGSLLTLPYVGDPLTPFEPALPVDGPKKVKRLKPDEIYHHTIPVTPLPYGSAKYILEQMTGQVVPHSWQGGLPFTYRIEGGKELTVRLKVEQEIKLTRVTDVVGTIVGSTYPDEWIIFGSHHDAWGFGAIDPNGGSAMLLTLADALGKMLKDGERPKRTIKICHWDAEEQGILGSSEWVEQFRDELTTKAVAYFNADASVSGANFGGSSSPSLKGLIYDVTKSVNYPKTNKSVYDHWNERQSNNAIPQLGNLGGGSDHVAFYTHIGIPSAGLGFSNPGGVYHSAYDNFAWFEKYGDSEFIYGPTLSRLYGVIGLRLANADILPYDLNRYATDLKDHVESIQKMITDKKIDFSLQAMQDAVSSLKSSSEQLTMKFVNNIDRLSDQQKTEINQRLIALEKAFIDMKGQSYGPWFRSLYASLDPYSGYAAWMLPAFHYELSLNQTKNLATEQDRHVNAFSQLGRQMDDISKLMN